MAFFFVISSFLPEIFKFLLICKLGTDDVTGVKFKAQNTKLRISLVIIAHFRVVTRHDLVPN